MKTYNGYKNYETWNVSIWINNDGSLHTNTRGMTLEQLRDYVMVLFIMRRKFGDLTKKAEINKVDWSEVYEAVL